MSGRRWDVTETLAGENEETVCRPVLSEPQTVCRCPLALPKRVASPRTYLFGPRMWNRFRQERGTVRTAIVI